MKRDSLSVRIAPLALLVVCAVATGQEVPPAMMVKLEDKSEPLKLAKVETDVRIFGLLAETKTTMTFANPHGRALEGELYFPLPAGATVSGYALDVGGVMVDGVAVEKHRARQVFEAEVRKGVDPGLVEYVKGNNFRTRVFPIPAGGSRTVTVKYVSEIIEGREGAAYQLPLNFKDKVGELSLRVEVVKAAAEPKIRQGGLANFAFKKWRDSYVAETKLTDAVLDKSLVIALPDVEKQNVLVERAPDGECYFVVHDRPQAPKEAKPVKAPAKVAIFWDASGSRGGVSHEKEFKIIEALFDRWRPRLSADLPYCAVDLVIFRNAAAKAERIDAGGYDPTKLIERLKAVNYDGGTSLGCIAPETPADQAEINLLFTDGLSNFGEREDPIFEGQLYIFSVGPTADHAYLQGLAGKSGHGQYFDLTRVDVKTAVAGIGRRPFSFISSDIRMRDIDSPYTVDAHPRTRQPVRGRFTIAGRLPVGRTTLILRYGQGGEATTTSEAAISRGSAVEGDMLRRFWAQKKLEELMSDEEANRDRIVELGKAHGLVTPHTSLLVLETLEQYVEHRVRPPKTLPKMREEYKKAIDTIEMQKKQEEQEQIERVVQLWQRRVEWWNKEFKYPKDFKYRPEAPATGPATQPAAGRDPEQIVAELRQAAERLDRAKAEAASAGVAMEAAQKKLASAKTEEQRAQAKAEAAAAEAKLRAAQEARAQAELDVARLRAEFERARQLIARLPDLSSAAQAPTTRPGLVVSVADLAAHVDSNANGGTDTATPLLRPDEAVAEDRRTVILGGLVGKEGPQPAGQPGIAVKAWDPKTPYLKDLKAVKVKEAFAVYMKHRKTYGNSPAFFLDCADFFCESEQPVLGLQILSNIAEMELESPQLLRVLGHRLAQLVEVDLAIQVFEEVLRLRPEEPQSYRDLALVLARRAGKGAPPRKPDSVTGDNSNSSYGVLGVWAWADSAKRDYSRALKLLNDVVMKQWDRFEEIELVALMEANAILPRAKAAGLAEKDIPLDPRLIRLLACDIRIVLTWDADMTDMDLHVVEPSAERVMYDHNRSTIGGMLSKDFTGGYGPEEYLIRKAMNGSYKIEVDYYGSSAAKLLGAVTIQVEIFTNFGRSNERRKSITRRLRQEKEKIEIGEVEF